MRPDDDEPQAVETKITDYRAAFGRPLTQRHPRISWKDNAGTHSYVVRERALVGSAPAAQIVITDPTVSRIHAELEPKEDGVWIRDLGSRNGTFVGGVLVTGARIPHGGSVGVGSTQIVFDAVEDSSAQKVWPKTQFGQLVGRSRVMRELFHYLASIATSDASVLIRGETGTGKEAVARSIHDASSRAGQPLVVVDCGAIPDNLIESELFGSVKGAFTGAEKARLGAIEAANKGTVFFDEIGELPLAMQPKLLRVLESREIRRLGEPHSRKVDVRFLSASHRDLRQMVNAGAFREDLYFRLAVLPVTIPPLREHLEDLPDLVAHFLPPGASVNPEIIQELAKRPWLGNVRELRNFMDRSLAVGIDRALKLSAMPNAPSESGDLSDPTSFKSPPLPKFGPEAGSAVMQNLPSLQQTFKTFREQWLDAGERAYVQQLLERHGRKVASAAEEAGLDRTYLYRLIRKHLL